MLRQLFNLFKWRTNSNTDQDTDDDTDSNAYDDPEEISNADHVKDVDNTSDELIEMVCEQCEKDGIISTAEGFCVPCLDYMCTMCLRYHARNLPKHILLDKISMPQDFCLDTCRLHPRERIKFYCKTCKDVACLTCTADDHKQCSGILHIPMFLKETDTSKDFKDTVESIDKISKAAAHRKQIADEFLIYITKSNEKNLQVIKKKRQEIKKTIEKQREQKFQELEAERAEVIRKLDEQQRIKKKRILKQEKQILMKIDEEAESLEKSCNNDLVSAQCNVSHYEQINSELKALANDIERKNDHYNKNRLFIATERANSKITQIKKVLEEDHGVDKLIDHEFLPLQKEINIDSPLETISLGSLHEMKIATESKIRVLGSGMYQGMVKASNSKFIVLYHKNRSVTFIDTEKILSSLKLPNSPYDITKIDNDLVAVTVPEEKRIFFITIENSSVLTVCKTINTVEQCYSIAYHNNCLIVIAMYGSSMNNGHLQFLDMAGTVLKTYTFHKVKVESFLLEISLINDILYIGFASAISGRFALEAFDSKSHTSVVNKEFPAWLCEGLATDKRGTVYVSSGKSIYKLPPDLSKYSLMFKCESKAGALHYCEQEDKLYVGLEEGIVIHNFT
ncbi:uncharacterized protein LOC128550816 [Mercenaria mercenaria]|uniref:uncharacterized protein LOC128550816 n=1 Tax=Mercenaria mercenaria TaxID=6596 RepID=UPI00234F42C5|nr:uncharacterized protein LOC128550816 [Mercenaria mercenaria]